MNPNNYGHLFKYRYSLQEINDFIAKPSWKQKKFANAKIMNNQIEIEGKICIPREEIEQLIISHYNNPLTGLKGRDKMWYDLNLKYTGIRLNDVRSVLNRLELSQTHRPINKSSIVRPIVIEKSAFSYMQMDLINIETLAPFNKQTKFLLTIIDLFSRYAYVNPIKNNTGVIVSAVLDQFLTSLPKKPSVMSSDNGAEFINGEVESVFENHGVKHIRSLPNKPESHGAVEAFNKTIKSYLFKFMANENTKFYLDALPSLVKNYNNSVHSTTKTRPVDAQKLDLDFAVHEKVVQNVWKQADKILSSRHYPPINIGDFVRLSAMVNSKDRALSNAGFRKGYMQNWSSEIWHVKSFNSVKKHQNQMYGIDRYTVEMMDENGNAVSQNVYRYDMQKIDINQIIPKKNDRWQYNGQFDDESHELGRENDARNEMLKSGDQDELQHNLLIHSVALNRPVRELKPRRQLIDEII